MNTQTQTTVQQTGGASLSSSSLLTQVGGGLVLVLFIFIVAAWIARRCQIFSGKVHGDAFFSVKRNQVLSQQGRLVVVEFNEQWLLLGVSNDNINCLATMKKPVNVEVDTNENVTPGFHNLLLRTLNRKTSEGKCHGD